MDELPYTREPRKEFAVKIRRCSCGEFTIEVIACEEILICEHGYEYRRPVYVTVYSTDDDDCDGRTEGETLVLSSEDELGDDVILAFRSVGKPITDWDREQVALAIEATHSALLDLYLEDHVSRN